MRVHRRPWWEYLWSCLVRCCWLVTAVADFWLLITLCAANFSTNTHKNNNSDVQAVSCWLIQYGTCADSLTQCLHPLFLVFMFQIFSQFLFYFSVQSRLKYCFWFLIEILFYSNTTQMVRDKLQNCDESPSNTDEWRSLYVFICVCSWFFSLLIKFSYRHFEVMPC